MDGGKIMTVLMTVDQLNERLKNNVDNTVILDTRFELTEANVGRSLYEEGHIPNAIHFDLNKDLSSTPGKHGGGHPIPETDVFAKKLGEAGIDNDTTVVIYDQANDMYAARAWWLLHYFGHENVYLLDGGFQKWVEAGYEVTKEIPQPEKKNFEAKIAPNLTVNMEEVKDKMANKSAILLDSRAKERYLGQVEPMYTKAGHIPGAKNYFWKQVLQEDGLWKDEEALKENFASLPKDEEIIVSCGSGVSACPNYIGLKLAGYENVKLYPGSYSDWVSYEENEVETKEE